MSSKSSPPSDGGGGGPYRLRDADASVKLASLLFLLVLGYSYVFAFLMVKHWTGLTPADVRATYVPVAMDTTAMPMESQSQTQALDLNSMKEEKHQVDTQLLIQDSHIHIMIYAIVAALESLIILGLEWGPRWRLTTITAAFAAGALDFSGQWLMKGGLGGFAWLTIVSGWLMAAVYLVVLAGTVHSIFGRKR